MRTSLSKHLRANARVCALCAVTACVYLAWLVVGAAVSFSPTRSREWRGRFFRAWARAVAHVVGMRVRVRGVAPTGPFLLVSNHLSYMDVVALASRLECVFVAKSEVARWPVVGRLCGSANTLFVNRRNRRSLPRVLDAVKRTLGEGSGVVLFAEGTSTGGARVAPFRPSLLEHAARERVPVHFASISYAAPHAGPHASEAVCWWGDMTFAKHFYGLLMLPHFDASLAFGGHTVWADDRKVLAGRLWLAVNAQFVPVV
jgi:1-acyl-sn-glycerol-3-phosphate acyltransferase